MLADTSVICDVLSTNFSRIGNLVIHQYVVVERCSFSTVEVCLLLRP